MPQVSVLMTVYNGMPYLVEAVDSVLRQTLTDWNLIIVDDGSTDGTAAWLDELDDPRIRVVHQKNAGAPAAANRGLALCDAPLVARLDADDVALPARLQMQRDFLFAHPRVGLVGTQVAPLGTARVGRSLSNPLDHESIMAALLNNRNGSVCHSSCMVRTQLLKEAGGYWDRGVAEDHDMYLRIAEKAELANLPETLLYFRVLPGGLTNQSLAELRTRAAYACELARRRSAKLAAFPYEEFRAAYHEAPWWTRLARAVDAYGMTQYRRALPEILGDRPLAGYARLVWAAACAPQLTVRRIYRVTRNRIVAPSAERPAARSPELKPKGGVAL